MARSRSQERSNPPRRRRQEVVAAAARIFHEQGYESTSIQDVADAVGILKGSLYYYIESKEDLLYEIIQGAHAEVFANLESKLPVDADPLQKLRVFVTVHVTFIAENLIQMSVFFHDFRSLSSERQREIIRERDRYDGILRSIIMEGQEDGLICPDVDPKLAAMGILGMMNWIYHWHRPGGERSAEAVAAEFADIILGGLVCSPSHTRGHRSELGRSSVESVETPSGATAAWRDSVQKAPASGRSDSDPRMPDPALDFGTRSQSFDPPGTHGGAISGPDRQGNVVPDE